ncbi:MAG: sigma-70 family RNA polymerase sigma factor [Eubacteriales bacterium]|nr:sigma-70 family RNA polymerase sigma factor [Eubacteriales bacterium]
MKNKDTYAKKIQNTFTAYVVLSVEGRRKKYLAKRNRVEIMEEYLEEDSITEPSVHFEEFYDKYIKEDILEKESQGTYLPWDELSDRNLVAAIRLLKQGERELLFQHIFEEKTFDEISRETGEARNKVENRYYYAVKKIRSWMGGIQ